jgi:hypothetical protein
MVKYTYLCVLFLTFKHEFAMRKTLFNLSLGFALTLGVFSFVGCGGSTEPAADTAAPATEAPAAEAPAAADTAAAAAPADTTKH